MKKISKNSKIEKQTKGVSSKIVDNPNMDAKNADSMDTKVVSPYEIFTKCISRSENLLSFQECKNSECKKEILDNHICDCYRAAIVLSISALDSFVRTIVSIKIKDKVRNESKISNELKNYIYGILSQKELFEAGRKDNFYMALEQAIKFDFRKQSFQSTEKISSFLEIIGYKNIFDNVAKKNNIHKDNLIKKLDKYTNRRHNISHRGDYDLEQTDIKELEISYEYAKDCIDTIRKIVKTINEIIMGDK